MRIDKAGDLRAGATVLVSVGALETVGATIVWVKDGSAGLRFATAIEPEKARAKAALGPKAVSGTKQPSPAMSPEAGWLGELNSPYRKQQG